MLCTRPTTFTSGVIRMSPNLGGGHSTRQPPGSACLHCRNKKMKCDTNQPRCKNCLSSGVECIRANNYSKKRGTPKDHSQVSQDRMGMATEHSEFSLSEFRVKEPISKPPLVSNADKSNYIPNRNFRRWNLRSADQIQSRLVEPGFSNRSFMWYWIQCHR